MVTAVTKGRTAERREQIDDLGRREPRGGKPSRRIGEGPGADRNDNGYDRQRSDRGT